MPTVKNLIDSVITRIVSSEMTGGANNNFLRINLDNDEYVELVCGKDVDIKDISHLPIEEIEDNGMKYFCVGNVDVDSIEVDRILSSMTEEEVAEMNHNNGY